MAVVQQQDVASSQAARQARQHLRGVGVACVVAAPGPAGQLQAMARQNGFQKRVAQPRHGPHEARRAAAGLRQRALSVQHLARQALRAVERQRVRVVLRVVLDVVAAPHDLARQRRVGRHALANAKEAGAHAGGVQHVEHLRGDGRVGAVVKGQRDFAARGGGGRQARQVRAQPVAARQQAGSGDQAMVDDQRAKPPGPLRRRQQQADAGRQVDGRREHQKGAGPPAGGGAFGHRHRRRLWPMPSSGPCRRCSA